VTVDRPTSLAVAGGRGPARCVACRAARWGTGAFVGGGLVAFVGCCGGGLPVAFGLAVAGALGALAGLGAAALALASIGIAALLARARPEGAGAAGSPSLP